MSKITLQKVIIEDLAQHARASRLKLHNRWKSLCLSDYPLVTALHLTLVTTKTAPLIVPLFLKLLKQFRLSR
jgi:hypothetical protein